MTTRCQKCGLPSTSSDPVAFTSGNTSLGPPLSAHPRCWVWVLLRVVEHQSKVSRGRG